MHAWIPIHSHPSAPCARTELAAIRIRKTIKSTGAAASRHTQKPARCKPNFLANPTKTGNIHTPHIRLHPTPTTPPSQPTLAPYASAHTHPRTLDTRRHARCGPPLDMQCFARHCLSACGMPKSTRRFPCADAMRDGGRVRAGGGCDGGCIRRAMAWPRVNTAFGCVCDVMVRGEGERCDMREAGMFASRSERGMWVVCKDLLTSSICAFAVCRVSVHASHICMFHTPSVISVPVSLFTPCTQTYTAHQATIHTHATHRTPRAANRLSEHGFHLHAENRHARVRTRDIPISNGCAAPVPRADACLREGAATLAWRGRGACVCGCVMGMRCLRGGGLRFCVIVHYGGLYVRETCASCDERDATGIQTLGDILKWRICGAFA